MKDVCRVDKLIVHTRRAMLTTVLVASAVAACTLFGLPLGLERARTEAIVVQSLFTHLEHYLETDPHLTVGSVLSGGYVPAHAASNIVLSISQPTNLQSRNLICTLRFNLHYPIFVFHGPLGIEYGHSPEKTISASHKSLIPTSSHVDVMASIPRTLSEFEHFWNLLDQTSAANVVALHVDEGEVLDLRRKQNDANPTRLSFSVTKQAKENEHKENRTAIWILSRGVGSGIAGIPNSTAMVKSWARMGYDILVSTACEEDNMVMATIPAKLGHFPFDWQRSWIERAVDEKTIIATSGMSGQYGNVFPNLKTLSAGHGNVLVSEVKEWLKGRGRSFSDRIVFFGMEIPISVILIFGPTIIVMMQFFALLYLLELYKLTKSRRDILQYRTEPWSVLYPGWLPEAGTFLATSIPVAGSIVAGLGTNIILSGNWELIIQDNPHILILVTVSVVLGACSLWAARKLCSVAKVLSSDA